MPYGCHIYKTESYMNMTTMCAYPLYHHTLPHWKRVLFCCANCPCIDPKRKESDENNSKTYITIYFHVYHLIVQCTVHGICQSHERKIYRLSLRDPYYVPSRKKYTRKEPVMI